MWHYLLGLDHSQDISLGFGIPNDFIYRWHVTATGRSFGINGNRTAQLGWFAPLDHVTGDPSLPDGFYFLPLQWFSHLDGVGVTTGVTLDGGIGDVHVELYTGVVIDLAIFTP